MASALTYIHAKVTVPLGKIDRDINDFIALLNRTINEATHLIETEKANSYADAGSISIWEANRRSMEVLLQDGFDLEEEMINLRTLLPEAPIAPKVEPNLVYIGTQTDATVRNKRFVQPLLGVLGTFMGLYTNSQIRQLENSLTEVRQGHKKLITVVEAQEGRIRNIKTRLDRQQSTFATLLEWNPGNMMAPLQRMAYLIRKQINRAFRVFQEAQHRRLAIQYLTEGQTKGLFKLLQHSAAEHKAELLIKQHSDLFQLEVSYFCNPDEINLLIHVPIIPTGSLLRLFKLHPFPLPLTQTHSLLPDVSQDVLAISTGEQVYSAQFAATDLLGCHQVNRVYLCERHGVLNRHFNQTCLGSLYKQDFESAKNMCRMKIYQSEEVVYPLLDNWYLVYSPNMQTVPVSCINGTSSEIFLTPGVRKINLSEGCRAHFAQHLVIADYSIRLETEIAHIESHSNYRLPFVTLPDEMADRHILNLRKSGLATPTLNDLMEFQREQTDYDQISNSITHSISDAVAAEHTQLKIEANTKTSFLSFIITVSIMALCILVGFILAIVLRVHFIQTLRKLAPLLNLDPAIINALAAKIDVPLAP